MALLLAASLAPFVACMALASAEGEEGEEAPNREVQAMNRGISVMLLGSVSFMMGLFYLVNQSDHERRKDSWMVISATISIFSAVLLFQGFYGIIEAKLLEGASEEHKCVVNMAQMLFWLVFLQVFTAWISGSLGSTEGKEATGKEKVKLDLDCFATLIGHITAFAAINAFASLQQMVPGGVGYKVLVAPLAWLFVFLCGKVFDWCRERFAELGDGEKDEFEQLWDEHAEETEDDIIGLAVSFLVTQVLRLSITGYMPNPEGEDPKQRVAGYSIWDVVSLAGWGLVILMLEGVRLVLMHTTRHPRLTPQMQNIAAMNVAWCLLFGTDWLFTMKTSYEGMMKKVTTALSLTFTAMSLIFLTDSLREFMQERFSSALKRQQEKEQEKRKLEHADDLQKFLQGLVKSLAILIGFSWEKAFDAAVEGVAEATESPPPYLTKLGLGFLLTCIVVPAWRFYILPTINEFEEQAQAEEEEEAKEIDPKAVEEEEEAEEEDKVRLRNARRLSEKREIRRQELARKRLYHEKLELERRHQMRRSAQVARHMADLRKSRTIDLSSMVGLEDPLLGTGEKSQPDHDARATDQLRRGLAQETAGQELREPVRAGSFQKLGEPGLGEGESGRAAACAEPSPRRCAHWSASEENAAASATEGSRTGSSGDRAYGGPPTQEGAQGLLALEGESSSLPGSSALANDGQSAARAPGAAGEIQRNASRYEERAAERGRRKADLDKKLDAMFSMLSDLDQRSQALERGDSVARGPACGSDGARARATGVMGQRRNVDFDNKLDGGLAQL